MTFKKIDDFKRRDEIVQEHLRLKDELKDRFISKRLGEEFLVKEREKIFKPITDKQEEENKILKEQKQLFENMLNNTNNPKAITEGPEKTSSITTLGPLVQKYIGSTDVDKTYGIIKKNDKLFMGETEVKVNNNDIMVDDVTYEGTPGLWNLIMEKDITKIKKNLDQGNYTEEDVENYNKILNQTKVFYKKDGNLRGTRSQKWKLIKDNFITPTDSGLKGLQVVTIPCDPNDLLKRMDLLIASKKAGNTGVDQELKAILKSLFKKKVIDKNQLSLLSQI